MRPNPGGVRCEALVFDFDGLLMDTEQAQVISWQHEWRHHGLELDLGDGFYVDHGDNNERRYAALAAAVGPSFDRAASHARRLAHRDGLLADLALSPGIPDLLAEAERRGLRLAVASSASRRWVETRLGQVGQLDRFELLACGDEVTAPKPDPAVYRLALERLGVPAERAIAFEDTPHGVAAAREAGLRCVAIPNPFAIPNPHADPGRYAHADLVVPSATHLRLGEIL